MTRELESSTGLYFNRARYYDPPRGRFLGGDPAGLGCGPNPYAYVGNNPVNRRDPSGRDCAWWDWWCQLQCQTCQALVTGICTPYLARVAYYVICPLVCAPFAESGIGYLVCTIVCLAVLGVVFYYECDYSAGSVCQWAGKC